MARLEHPTVPEDLVMRIDQVKDPAASQNLTKSKKIGLIISKLTRFAVIGLLALLSAIVAAETPDECTRRLSSDIRIETYEQATAWYDQVWRECAPEPENTDERMLPVQTEDFGFSNTRMYEAGCEIFHVSADLMPSLDISFSIPRGDDGFYWRYEVAGIWHPFQPGEVGDENPPPRGIHQIVLRTNQGEDKFGIIETWATKWNQLSISC